MTDQASAVDWGKPLEAVHEDGRVVPVTLFAHRPWPDTSGDYQVRGVGDGSMWSFFKYTGRHPDHNCPWTIRNRQPTPPPIPPEVVERMVALVRRCADSAMASGDLYTMREATAIVAALPEPVDPDLVEARQIIVESYGTVIDSPTGSGPARVHAIRDGKGDTMWEMVAVLAAIRRGRALAAAEREGVK